MHQHAVTLVTIYLALFIAELWVNFGVFAMTSTAIRTSNNAASPRFAHEVFDCMDGLIPLSAIEIAEGIKQAEELCV
jgi:hypothetical protein